MGISATQFWATSTNGKAMMLMLAEGGHIELCKDTCEWLVDQREVALRQELAQSGLSPESCKLKAKDLVADMRRMAESINDRNVRACVEHVVDKLFQRFYAKGPKDYERVMADLASVLRAKIVD